MSSLRITTHGAKKVTSKDRKEIKVKLVLAVTKVKLVLLVKMDVHQPST